MTTDYKEYANNRQQKDLEKAAARDAQQSVKRQKLHEDIDFGEVDFDEIDNRQGKASFGSASAAANLLNSEGENANPETGPDQGSGGYVRRERHKKHKKKVRRKRVIIGVLAALLVLIVAGIVAANVMLDAARQNLQTVEGADLAGEDTVTYDEGERVEYNGHTYTLNKNMVSIAFMGLDQEKMEGSATTPGQTDAIMVVAVDSVSGAYKIIAIPRDTMVDVGIWVGGGYAGTQRYQLCVAYGFGGGGENSILNTTDAISRIMLGIPMNYYYVLNLDGVGKITSAVGGVTVTALETIPKTDIVEGETITLTGDEALSYVRYRDTSINGSAMLRLSRQTQFVKAFAAKVLEKAKAGSVMDLLNLVNTVSDNSSTNLEANEIIYLASRVISNGSASVDIETLKGTTGMEGDYTTFTPDETALKELILSTYYTQLD